MNAREIAMLLASCASADKRTVGEADVIAWLDWVGDLDYADAVAAVKAHYSETRDWIMPSDIRRRVRATRAARIAAAPPVEPSDAAADDPAVYRREMRAAIAAAAAAPAGPRAIGGAR